LRSKELQVTGAQEEINVVKRLVEKHTLSKGLLVGLEDGRELDNENEIISSFSTEYDKQR